MNVKYLSIKFNLLFLTLSLNIFSYISSDKIVLPFFTKSYPFDPNDEFKFIFKNEIYTTLDVGTPSQKVELYITTRTPLFMIKYNSSFPEYYKNISSSTYKYYDNASVYINDEVLEKGIHSGEKIFLQYSFNSKDRFEFPNLDFIYGTKYKGDSKRHMGVLGIQFSSTSFIYDKEVNFINILKKNRLITNYIWYLNYTSEDSGFLVIGEYPHSFDKKYDKEYLNPINVYQEGGQKAQWKVKFDNIKYGEKLLNDHRTGSFAPQYGVVFCPLTFQKLITSEFFEEYINNNKCKMQTYDNKHDYYVCDEDINLSKFKDIEFTIKELSNKNFVLSKNDLFLKKNRKLYFLMAFGKKWKWNYSWTFGKPFIKKYNFLFDQDGKQILYYNEKENDVINNFFSSKTFVYLLWSGIFILLIIIGFLIYYLTRVLKERKKRLFELEDEFDYVEKPEKKNNNGKDAFKFEGKNEENKFGIE